jgi:hypothetical protein
MSWVHVLWLLLIGAAPLIYGSGDADWILLYGNLAKVFSLLVCAISLTLTQDAFSTDDTPHKAWTFLASGMWIWFFAQVIFCYYKVVAAESPYPSLADVFFVIAYAPLLVGVVFLIKDFRSTGLPMGSRQSYAIQAGLLLAAYAVIFVTLLYHFLVTDDAPALKFLNVGYPTFDFVLIALTSVLVRISWALRGGSLARSWLLLCSGFTMLGIADITFAYRSDPLLDLLFFSAYFLIGLAGVFQIRMLRQ